MSIRQPIATALLALICIAPPPAPARGEVNCTMTFTLSGWSAFYKTALGRGRISCSNGQSATVKLTAKGGGPTVGKYAIDDGHGKFSPVSSIGETLGSYVSAEAHAGAVKSAAAMVMTKGEVSLALTGKGRGVDLGIDFGKLVIER